jgi:hypothetical protein
MNMHMNTDIYIYIYIYIYIDMMAESWNVGIRKGGQFYAVMQVSVSSITRLYDDDLPATGTQSNETAECGH